MKVGDKIKIVDEEGVFIIKKIKDEKVIVEDVYGFEQLYSLKYIIPDNTSLDYEINSKEISIKSTDLTQKKILNNKKILKESREVDLHIGNLVDSLKGLSAHKMLEKQLFFAKNEIVKAKNENLKSLILIHGKGRGVLKKEIYKLLSTIEGIEYLEADIIKYRFGAVEIRFK